MAATSTSNASSPGIFQDTRWTLVQRLQAKHWSESALNELCTIYWKPVYRYVTMLGQSHQDAEDLTQEFFAHSLRKALFENANPECGKLRSFICVTLNNLIIDRARAQQADKRGGQYTRLPLDITELEESLFTHCQLAPDEILALEAGRELFKEVWTMLRESFTAHGEEAIFEIMSPFIAGRKEPGHTQVAAAALINVTPTAFWNRLDRARKRYRVLLKDKIAETTSSDDVHEELRYLHRLFASHPR